MGASYTDIYMMIVIMMMIALYTSCTHHHVGDCMHDEGVLPCTPAAAAPFESGIMLLMGAIAAASDKGILGVGYGSFR